MNIATTTGFPECIIYNSYERVAYIVYTYIGNGLFALAFGMMAAATRTLPEKYEFIFDNVNKVEGLFNKKIPPKLKTKLESYYSYVIENQHNSALSIQSLKPLFPEIMFNQIKFSQFDLINTHPIFSVISSKVCL
mmetsp:Transcript_7218/g.6493  ORF Transcript_7218/g.6493 Transcript_7218/m.6493 type:complete len:135 (-) Transcript_7218:185-589(-)